MVKKETLQNIFNFNRITIARDNDTEIERYEY